MKDERENNVVGRTQNVTKNILWAIISQATTVLLSLVSRKIFLDVLGPELLGANSLFADVFSLFSFADLGFGTALVFSLYKPIASKDTDKIQSLLKYYKTIYRYVIVVLIVIGIAFVPFLPHLKTNIPLNQLALYYFLYLVNSVIGYIYAYRESYVSACQQQRTITKFNTFFAVAQLIVQIIVVKTSKSYLLYVLSALIVAIIRKIAVNCFVKKAYPETKVKYARTLSKKDRKYIFLSARAILVHRLGNLAINQTDSLIVSTFISVAEWGLMSNYLVIKTAVSRFFDSIYGALLPSMGNLVACETDSRQLRVFKTYDFMNFWLCQICYVALGTLSSPFVSIFFGKEYALNELTVFIFFTAFYIDGLRSPVSAMREANGSFRTDQWYTVLAAVVNLIVSIILVQRMGLNGVYIGTCCAMIVLHVARSILLSKAWKVFKASTYLLRESFYVLNGIMMYILTFYTQRVACINIDNQIVRFLIYGICVVVVPNIITFLLYRKDDSFVEAQLVIKKRISRIP